MFGMSPKIALSFLANRIEAALGVKIDSYELHYNAVETKVHFIVSVNNEKRKYPFDDGEKLCMVITEVVKKELPKGSSIEYVQINYSKENLCNAIAYYTDPQGNKERLTQDI